MARVEDRPSVEQGLRNQLRDTCGGTGYRLVGGSALGFWRHCKGCAACEAPDPRLQAVVEFLDSWRFCPVSSAESPARSCVEDAARQLLDAIDAASSPP